MIDKTVGDFEAAVAGVFDGASVMIGGFGTAGMPDGLIDALIAQGATDLTVINNNAGNGETGLAALLKAKRVRKIICSFPRQSDSQHFDALYRAGQRLPLRFFPKSAWALVRESESKALGVWVSERTRGESDDPALRMAFRGTELKLDDAFSALAKIVFNPLLQHLRSDA